MSIRVLLADDQPLVLLGFAMIVNAQADMEVVGEANDGAEAVRLTELHAPDVVLMDVRMPVLDGLSATRLITAADDGARVLVLTTFDLDDYAFEAVRAGASGFLLKNAKPDELLAGIRAVASGDAVLAPSTTRRLLDSLGHRFALTPSASPDALGSLTTREREVFDAMAAGLSNAEIAGRLFVSETTVKTHVGRILAKLGLRDRVHAVIYAYENGLTARSG
jgi:DNA-binding NarL/FixJ family response regulator